MNLDFSDDDLAFREEVRRFLAEDYPADIKEKQDRGISLEKEDIVRWQKLLNDKGWAAVNWPKEYGGTGWTPTQKHIFQEEMAEANAPGIIPFGFSMVGPVIYTFGNEEQKKEHLPKILNSDVWWCQGYSEPGAGSDLAGLSTKAVRDGDDYIVNGTKTWTTLAQYADWIFCLVRTDPDAKKQEGISFLLIDMKTPGITVRPIITIEGGHEVNEVHFEDVRVPVSNRIGEENKGWTYAKSLLAHERTGIAGVGWCKQKLHRLKEISRTTQVNGGLLMDDPAFATKIASAEIDLAALEYTVLRTVSAESAGKGPGPESSILKIVGTEVQQLLTELLFEASGYYGVPDLGEPAMGDNDPVGPDFGLNPGRLYLNHRKATIYGGTNEIQKNIIAKAVLGV